MSLASYPRQININNNNNKDNNNWWSYTEVMSNELLVINGKQITFCYVWFWCSFRHWWPCLSNWKLVSLSILGIELRLCVPSVWRVGIMFVNCRHFLSMICVGIKDWYSNNQIMMVVYDGLLVTDTPYFLTFKNQKCSASAWWILLGKINRSGSFSFKNMLLIACWLEVNKFKFEVMMK